MNVWWPEQEPRPHLRVITGDCEHDECRLAASWVVRRANRRAHSKLCCGRHLTATCKELSEGGRSLTVSPVRG